jgi:uncharacterized protein (UPF0335 family)
VALADARQPEGGGRAAGRYRKSAQQSHEARFADPRESLCFRGIMADVGGVAGEQLKSFIERIERLEEEKNALSGDIKEVYAEAKGNGFEPKIMRQIIKIRKMDKDALDEQESLLDLYKRALGMAPEAELEARAAE